MNSTDTLALQKMVADALSNAEAFNKVYLGAATIVAAVLATLIAALVQIYLARLNRRTQTDSLLGQLEMQELASRRIAAANIAAKRQTWIDELRGDIASFMALWRDVTLHTAAHSVENRKPVEEQDSRRSLTEKELQAFLRSKRGEYSELRFRIALRLNPEEQAHIALSGLLAQCHDMQRKLQLHSDKRTSKEILDAVESLDAKILSKSHEILKGEWNRIKREIYVAPQDLLTPPTPTN